MSKRVYISADYSPTDGDRDVIDVLHGWSDNRHLVVDYVDTAQVVSGSISRDSDCRPCDLKSEFNKLRILQTHWESLFTGPESLGRCITAATVTPSQANGTTWT